MTEDNVTKLTPAEEDPIVDRWLASLPELSPSAEFEDTVMARVRVPAPRWVQSVQTATRALFNRKRLWIWAGGYAAASAASVAVIVTLMVSHWVQVETAWSTFVGGFVLEAWRASVALVGRTVAATLATQATWDVTGTVVLFASLAGAAVMAGSAWGLYRLMTSVDTERISFHASR